MHQGGTGGFQWLQKPDGKPDGDTVLIPKFFPLPSSEPYRLRIRQGLTIQIGQQNGGGLILAHKVAGIYVAVAGAMLERDAPLPPGLGCRWASVGDVAGPVCAGDGRRPV